MAVKKKTTRKTKKDLEDKIAELERKLVNLSAQLEPQSQKTTSTTTKPTPPPKQQQQQQQQQQTTKPQGTLPKGTLPKDTKPTPPPPPKQQTTTTTTTKPKGVLPKGVKPPSSQTPPPTTTPKSGNAATINDALEHAYQNAAMTDFHQYRAKVTGYTPAPHRYFVRRTAPVGKVPTTSWHSQKATVAGYTQPSNQYFATRARLAYHPPDKTFVGYGMQNSDLSTLSQTSQTDTAPPPPKTETVSTTISKKPKGALPKGMVQKPTTQQTSPQTQTGTTTSNDNKSRQEKLDDYEKDYLQRLEQQKADAADAKQEVESNTSQTRGTLPKGFKPATTMTTEKPKSKGTLPKGF